MESETADDAMEVDGDDGVRDDVEPVSDAPCLCLHARASSTRLFQEDGTESPTQSPRSPNRKRTKWREAEGHLAQKKQEMDKAKVSFLPFVYVCRTHETLY